MRTVKILIATFLFLANTSIAATKNPAPQATTTETSAAAVTTSDADSREVRSDLRAILNRYPESVGMVLKIDPTLFGDATYMASYPALAAFVSQHPEVAHNPEFYLEDVPGPAHRDPNPPAFRMSMEILGALGGFSVFLVVTYVLLWAIRALIQQRRWSRLTRIQTEVHSKLLDRFTSNEELLAYIQSPAGRKFLESAPIPLDEAPRPIGAPLGRIFGSMQAGLVLTAGGIGLDIASLRLPAGASEGLYAVAVVAICIGLALIASAAAFYLISRRVGLWQSAGEAGAQGTVG